MQEAPCRTAAADMGVGQGSQALCSTGCFDETVAAEVGTGQKCHNVSHAGADLAELLEPKTAQVGTGSGASLVGCLELVWALIPGLSEAAVQLACQDPIPVCAIRVEREYKQWPLPGSYLYLI